MGRIGALREGDHPSAMPPWARFLLNLGSAYGNWDPDKSAVTVLSLPTLSFAAPLLVAGAVLSTMIRTPIEEKSPETKFAELCKKPGLPVSFTVTLQDGRVVMKTGVTAGSGFWKQRPNLKITYYEDKNGSPHSRNIYLEDISSVHELAVETVDLNHRQRGITVAANNSFLDALLGDQRAAELTTTSLPTCVVVSNKSAFLEECELQTFVETDSGTPGALIDLIRPDAIPRYTSTCRTLLLPAAAGTLPEEETSARVLILVGNKASIRHALVKKFPFTILLLDRTERDYEAAEDLANNLYSQRSSSFEMSPSPSATIRLMAFHR